MFLPDRVMQSAVQVLKQDTVELCWKLGDGLAGLIYAHSSEVQISSGVFLAKCYPS